MYQLLVYCIAILCIEYVTRDKGVCGGINVHTAHAPAPSPITFTNRTGNFGIRSMKWVRDSYIVLYSYNYQSEVTSWYTYNKYQYLSGNVGDVCLVARMYVAEPMSKQQTSFPPVPWHITGQSSLIVLKSQRKLYN